MAGLLGRRIGAAGPCRNPTTSVGPLPTPPRRHLQNLPETLRTYLVERLTQDAAERHINAGIRASHEFQALLDRRLTRPDGGRRKVAAVPTGELIDRYGRLLAYLAPWFSGSASDPLPPRDDPSG